MSDAFYSSIEPVEDFEALALQRSYMPLPDDWAVVAADVRGSTKAIAEGRYQDVNTVGVSVIAALRNVAQSVEVPYVFGGDGAIICIPDRFVPAARVALGATVSMARRSFDLTLRAAIVPVSFVRGRAHDVLVARHRVSEDYVQCALFGGGAEYVERSLKEGLLPVDFVVEADDRAAADYSGLECRWKEIPSPAAETVAVIVKATGNTSAALATYRRVMERTRQIYGGPDQCRPVVEEGLQLTMSGRVLSRETRPKLGRRGPLARILAAVTLHATVLGARILFRVGPRVGATDWGSYKRDVVVNTDFRKFDGSVRLVLAGTAAQREDLDAFLGSLREAGEVSYGMHVADSALMTCLVDKRQGAHFHFVDAAGGGYATAAVNLKRGTGREPS